MDHARLQLLLEAASRAKVTCVGDIMLDRFVYGEVTRTSPEAPVPVLLLERSQAMLGGAGNVARNIAALGGSVALVGVLGVDAAAEEARGILAGSGIESCVVADPSRPTTEKIRYVAAGQQLLRVDAESCAPIGEAAQRGLVAAVHGAAEGAGAILLSDYGKGAVTAELIAACQAAAKANGAVLVVDSKARDPARYGAVDVIKPNVSELSRFVDLPTGTNEEVEAALTRALELNGCRAILVTRAARGMSLAVRGAPILHFSGLAREVFDVSGAGDTALAALGLVLAGGGGLEDAAQFALLASAAVVGKRGTATVSPQELIQVGLAAHLAPAEAKVVTVAGMAERAAQWRAQGLKVGFTNGCFDILHKGHIAYLAQSKSWCDRLIVAINSDRSVQALKGDGRPINDLESRALVLAGLTHVDLVAPFDEATPLALIEAARPDVLIKGADYSLETVVGADLVHSWGGEVRLAALVDGYSTTAAIARITEKA